MMKSISLSYLRSHSICLSDLYHLLTPQRKAVFLTAIVMGLLAHGKVLINDLYYHDNIYGLFTLGSSFEFGRWMLGVLQFIEESFWGTPVYALSLLRGVGAIMLIAICSCVIVETFKIKSHLSCSLFTAGMVTFPSVASLFGYMFLAEAYMLGLLFIVLGAKMVCSSDKVSRFFVGSFLIAIGVGFYQAYIPFVLVIYLCFFFYYLNSHKESIANKTILQIIFKLFLSCVCFLLLYFIISKFFLFVLHVELSSYKSINSIPLSPLVYLQRIILPYKYFLVPDQAPYRVMYFSNLRFVYYILVIIISILSFVNICSLYKDGYKKVALLNASCYAFLPFCMNFIYIMCPLGDIYGLMQQPQTLIFLYLIVLIQNMQYRTLFCSNCVRLSVCGIIAVLVMGFVRIDNILYLKASFVQQQTISYFTTLISQIKSLPDYRDELSVCFVGDWCLNDRTNTDTKELRDIKIPPYDDLTHHVNDYSNYNFIELWCGYKPVIVDAQRFSNMEMVKNMPIYPNAGSIQIINNTIVVKLSSN